MMKLKNRYHTQPLQVLQVCTQQQIMKHAGSTLQLVQAELAPVILWLICEYSLYILKFQEPKLATVHTEV